MEVAPRLNEEKCGAPLRQGFPHARRRPVGESRQTSHVSVNLGELLEL